MLAVPDYESLVDGFDLAIIPNPLNIASGGSGQGSHLVEDGFLKLLITNTGENPFWPNPFQTAAIILRLKEAGSPEIVSEYSTCLLGPEDSPVFIELSEKEIEGLGGIWVEVLCESPEYPEPDDYLSFGFRVERHGLVGHG